MHFGLAAVLVSEIPATFNEVAINATNVTILLSGLFYGWPAGLVGAGIAALERGLSLIWNPENYLIVPAIISALISGGYAFILRKYFFKDKKPNFIFASVTALVTEAIYLLIIMLVHLDDTYNAFLSIGKIAVFQLIFSAVVALVFSLVNDLLERKSFKAQFTEKKEITFKIQHLMLGVVAVLFALTSGAIYGIQNTLSDIETNRQLKDAIEMPLEDLNDKLNDDTDLLLHQIQQNAEATYSLQDGDYDGYLDNLFQNYTNYFVSFFQIVDSNGSIKGTADYNNSRTLVIPNGFNYKSATASQDPDSLCSMVMSLNAKASYNDATNSYSNNIMPLTDNFLYTPFQYSDSNPANPEKLRFCAVCFDHNRFNQAKTDVDMWTLVIGFNKQQSYVREMSIMGNLTNNVHIGRKGVSLIFKSTTIAGITDYETVSGPADFMSSTSMGVLSDDCPNFKEIIENIDFINAQKEFTNFELSLRGEPGFAMVHKTYNEASDEYVYYISLASQEEMLSNRDNSILINTLLEILIFAVLFFFIYLLLNKSVVKSIDKVKNSLNNISDGNLNEVVDVNNSVEFVQLSSDINKTVDTLKGFIEKEKNRMAQDLALAKSIQKNALPSVYPNDSRITIAASMNTAKEVGGDFYDFYVPNEDQVNIVIADVSGKGVPAALFMMRAKTQLKSLSEKLIPISDVFNQANKELCNGNDAGMFVTTWQGNLNLKTGVMQLVNAGHNPPVIKHKNGKFEYLKTKVGFVLAGFDMFSYQSADLKLEKGDQILLYTDGITEAHNINNELYGDDRLLDLLNGLKGDQLKPENVIQEVFKDITKFSGEAPQFDDETMVCFVYNGK